MHRDKEIAVIYLSYIPYGVSLLVRFIDSYKQHDAGQQHSLHIIFKGMENDADVTPFLDILNKGSVSYKSHYYRGEGMDIEAYRWAASEISSEYLFFLNSSSEICNSNWLLHFAGNMTATTGLIGATGSLQSYYSSVYQKQPWAWESQKGFLYNFRKYKLFIKAFFYWRFFFNPFPNPHIRTNAIMVKRNEFLDLASGTVNTKFKAYQFENGRKSLTNHYLQKGLQIFVVDKNGKLYEPSAWADSATFWINDQQNLLVSDNQTRIYRDADEENRKSMTKLAWGI